SRRRHTRLVSDWSSDVCASDLVVLCERTGSLDALRSSARLVRGNWRRAAVAWLVTVLIILGLGALASLLGRLCSMAAALLTADRSEERRVGRECRAAGRR